MFEEYNPIENKIFRIINNEGEIINTAHKPELSDNDIINAYKSMFFSRTADAMSVSYQRQGRMFTYPPNFGQEAIAVAAGMVMKENDWLVPAFRELGAWLAKGATMKEIFLYYMGYEEGTAFNKSKRILPFAVPIASQLLHAAGIGYGINYKNLTDEAVFAFVGDGGTSEGDFSEALNFAGVWNAPVIFTVQNNQYAISMPLHKQTKAMNLAVKSLAFGISGIQVDGNDFFAMYAALAEARKMAIAGKGPVLIEALTYRKGAHTTSDDPTKYRSKEEEEKWDQTDPLKRLKGYLIKNKLWNIDEEALTEQYKKEIDSQFEAAEQYNPYELDDVFKYMYSEIPDELLRQKKEYEEFLKWKELRK
jgi:pyruvate dehydrogenase E1 component alpha subunit